MSDLGMAHVAFAMVAMGTGALILARPKGTRSHRRIGRVYTLSMLGLNATALMIYRLFGYFGPFHVLALISLFTVIAGVIPVLLRRPKDRWIEVHYRFITGSYVGLIAALAAEIAVRVPATHHRPGLVFAALVIVPSLVVGFIGGALISRGRRTTLARFTARRAASPIIAG
jgi:uncharacterized membrane protein